MIEVGGEINPYEVAGQCLNKDRQTTLKMGSINGNSEGICPSLPRRFQGGRITVGVVGKRHFTGTSVNFNVCSLILHHYIQWQEYLSEVLGKCLWEMSM